MPVPLENFPIAAVVDGLLSYTQYLFNNPEITPSTYRWNSDDRASRIRISGPFVIDNEKPMSAPFIVIERGGFQFANGTIDNFRSSDPNTFENKRFSDWSDGPVNVICGSSVASEASSIANFLAIMFQSDRHGIKKTLRFVRNLNYATVGPEIPVVRDNEIRRWEVTLTLSLSLQFGWIHRDYEEQIPWTKAGFYEINKPSETFSDTGIVSEGSDILTDSSKSFGYLNSNNPQLLQQEMELGWYYIKFNNNDQLYTISEIVDENNIRLTTHDEDGNTVPYSAPETAVDVEYNLYWNGIHLRMELPTNS